MCAAALSFTRRYCRCFALSQLVKTVAGSFAGILLVVALAIVVAAWSSLSFSFVVLRMPVVCPLSYYRVLHVELYVLTHSHILCKQSHRLYCKGAVE